MNILIIGSGGREHALAWKLKASPLVDKLYAAPGSAGMAELAEPTGIAQDDFEKLAGFCLEKQIELAVVGPEAPLSKGAADFLSGRGVKVFGPSQKGAMLEASKQFAKEFMHRHYIPTADFQVFYDSGCAREKIKENKKYPLVIKADGLASGKGVRICENEAQALEAVSDFMEKRVFGYSGSKIIIEEFLVGKEVSVMALIDGETFLMLPVSRDHKRLLDNNEGPNTGGMGAFCPVPLDAQILEAIKKEVLERFLAGIKKDRLPYRGVIYAGLMLTEKGPKTLEFNVRFGDPETQCLMPMIKSDLAGLMLACAEGKLAGKTIETEAGACVCVTLAARGYPGNPEKGAWIQGLDKTPSEVLAFHSGTSAEGGRFFVNGGRVLGVMAIGADISSAAKKAYAAIKTINFDGMQYRRDIGA
ncbi:MAG TPA: phosphoribosylamine--glycine ligase [Elusimicrobia bacterium]|nr:phosphoribosylamine--glycine ligase [Elusimicrobiota bacterium]